MLSNLPIHNDEMFSEFYNMGFSRGRHHAWLHGKNCPDSSCSCIQSLQEAVALIPHSDTQKNFLVRVGYVAGFAAEREGDMHEYDGEDQTDRTEASGQPT